MDTQAIAARLTALLDAADEVQASAGLAEAINPLLEFDIPAARQELQSLSAHVETLTHQVADKFGGDALVIEAREGEKRMLAKLEESHRTNHELRQENARLTADRDEWKHRAEDAEGRIANALA